jgi:CPA2 family monovalent cation:H+ antiporter-2
MDESIFVRDLAVILLVAASAGWLAQRAGLSAVVGYLVAGMAIGPLSPGLRLISDPIRVQLLAQIGLIFLMFAIGLGLSLARLQRMGASIVAAVAISSLLLFNLCRWFGVALGWDSFQILFLAGTLMISSSAIIIKVLDELNITHQRAGQLALGITVLEDVVAVVMLTLFISLIKIGDRAAPLGNAVGLLAAFVVFLVVVAMLLVPRVLGLLGRDPNPELRVIAVTALVLLASLAALKAGYSLALGAFVMGVVVAGTRHKDEVENAFGALHNIFGAVFFVAVGMMCDVRLLADVGGLILLVTTLTVVARPLACAFGLVAAGHDSRDALKAGLALTPVGEFAFVLIQVGKSANVLPDRFYALGIGVSLATAIIGPLLTRRSEDIATWVEAREPKAMRSIITAYHRWLGVLQDRSSASLLWRLSSKRVVLTSFHLLFVSALILLARPLYTFLLARVSPGFLLPLGFALLYWIGFAIILTGPVIIIGRNLEALAMILADGVTRGSRLGHIFRPLLQTLLKGVACIMALAWLLALVPHGRWMLWLMGFIMGVILVASPFFWRRLVTLRSQVENDLREKMKTAATVGASSGLASSVLERPQEWNLQIDEVVLPTRSDHAGRRILDLGIRQRFGCSIMVIERQGFLITNPAAAERLFAGDKLLLLGAAAQLPLAEQFLRGPADREQAHAFDTLAMETVTVPAQAPRLGENVAGWDLVGRFGIQICGIERAGRRILVPASIERILGGDKLLLLGAHDRIEAFRASLGDE